MLVGSVGTAHAGTTYRFTVYCPSVRAHVAEWRTGDIDPGEEWLRVATGTKNPGCDVVGYNQTAAGFPVEIYEGAAGVVHGIPLIGTVLSGILGL